MPSNELTKSSSKKSSKKSASLTPKGKRSSKLKTLTVGIVGKAGAGKSTLAYWLQQLLSKAEIHSLARPVKEIAFALVRPQIEANKTPTINSGFDKERLYKIGSRELTGRKLLQIIGTEFGRYLDQDIWLSMLFEDIENRKQKYAIVDDVRFLNEFEAMDVRIGIIDANAKPNDFGNHASESEMDGLLMPEKLDLLLVRKGDTYSPVVAGKPKGKITAADIAAMIAEVKK